MEGVAARFHMTWRRRRRRRRRFSVEHTLALSSPTKEQTSNRWRATGIVRLQRSNNGTWRHRNVCFARGSRLEHTPTAGGVYKRRVWIVFEAAESAYFRYDYTERKPSE